MVCETAVCVRQACSYGLCDVGEHPQVRWDVGVCLQRGWASYSIFSRHPPAPPDSDRIGQCDALDPSTGHMHGDA